MDRDPEIESLIRQWMPPEAPAGMDTRMMARFHRRRQPLWRRRLELRVCVPAPVVAVMLLVLLACGAWWAVTAQARMSFRERMGGFEPVAAPQLSTAASAVEVLR